MRRRLGPKASLSCAFLTTILSVTTIFWVKCLKEDKLISMFGDISSDSSANKRQMTPLNYVELELQELNGGPPPAKKKLAARGTIHIAADLRVVLKHADPIEEDKKAAKRAAKKAEDNKPEALLMKEHFAAQLPLSAKDKDAVESIHALDQANISQWTLTVNFLNATKIKKADRWGKSDPYVKVYVNEVSAGKSQVQSKTLNPVWNEMNVEMLITRKKHFGSGKKGKRPSTWRDSSLVFEIFDHDMVGLDDPIGRITLKGEELSLFLATSATTETSVRVRSLYSSAEMARNAPRALFL